MLHADSIAGFTERRTPGKVGKGQYDMDRYERKRGVTDRRGEGGEKREDKKRLCLF